MAKDGRKVAIGLGLVAGVGIAIALATRAKAAPPVPGLANLYGTVTNAETEEPLSGVLISLDGITTHTDVEGNYVLTDLVPGDYTLIFERGGYIAKMSDVTLVEGENVLNVGLVPIPPPVASLYGIVTNAETAAPISGVKVTIDGLIAYTNASGEYGFTGLTPGTYTIIFEKEGYETVIR